MARSKYKVKFVSFNRKLTANYWNTCRQQFFGGVQADDKIHFDDIMRQMNDLIRPKIPGQFTLKDFKKNGFLAERFFDTFINFDRFQVHESRQEGSIRGQQTYQNKEFIDAGIYGAQEPVIFTDDFGFPVLRYIYIYIYIYICVYHLD